ncbi:hypothetical protein MUK42_16294 [Musa troglodytarum]|uniref:Uncharacterized protein n=1 Tax=Musa troglodytarum TaxID=320322 RepID=A0A9E7L2S3_9LILI|nr:hypothetical protein MUK42_16294 [Musa troglodytarum]
MTQSPISTPPVPDLIWLTISDDEEEEIKEGVEEEEARDLKHLSQAFLLVWDLKGTKRRKGSCELSVIGRKEERNREESEAYSVRVGVSMMVERMNETRQGVNWGGETTESATNLGFWIRRAAYLASMTGSGSTRVQSVVFATDDKENITPSRAARRRGRTRKSPLPEWYPRTPLRDITVIVNALERRRMRVRAAATARKRTSDPEPAAVGEGLLDTSSSPAAAGSSSVSATEQPPHISSSSNASSPRDDPPDQPTEYEKNLEIYISEMERLVTENLKRSPMPPAKRAKRTLISMR